MINNKSGHPHDGRELGGQKPYRLAGGAWGRQYQKVNEEIFRQIASALEQEEPVVLATVARTRGSTPRKTGAKMVVRKDGSFFGTIGGGCGEAEVWQEAMEVLEDGSTRIVTVDLTEPTDGEDKICGGVMDVFVERLT
tara:strand:+ start:207 stop:620 length:414 start_codon:yes stop_codon:yes gene_type:complete